MTPDQYAATRKQLGLTQAGLAKHLGVTRETIARRETGEREIQGEAVIALEYLKLNLSQTTKKHATQKNPKNDRAV